MEPYQSPLDEKGFSDRLWRHTGQVTQCCLLLNPSESKHQLISPLSRVRCSLLIGRRSCGGVAHTPPLFDRPPFCLALCWAKMAPINKAMASLGRFNFDFVFKPTSTCLSVRCWTVSLLCTRNRLVLGSSIHRSVKLPKHFPFFFFTFFLVHRLPCVREHLFCVGNFRWKLQRSLWGHMRSLDLVLL